MSIERNSVCSRSIVKTSAVERPIPISLCLAQEYGLNELDGAWAVRPPEPARNRGRTMLALDDANDAPLARRRAHGFADSKVRQLDRSYRQSNNEPAVLGPKNMIATPVEHLELATAIKVLQAVSSEVVPEKVIDAIVRTAIEHAGAERAVLLLARAEGQSIAADGTASGGSVVVNLRNETAVDGELPQSVLQHVLSTRESLTVDDAAAQDPFATDTYVRARRPRSVLCLPLLNQAKLIGVLYLESNLAPRLFASRQTAIVKLIASQAAITLENSRLYRDVAHLQAKIRRLIDANIIGVAIWNPEGRIVDANDAFLRVAGYEREDIASGRVHRMELTGPEQCDSDSLTAAGLQTTGAVRPFEKEYLRKDGSRVPVLIKAATFEDAGEEGVAFVLDRTERKRAEAEARESERRHREMEMELVHANRAATMGQLTASIAHEVNQPIAAALTNAETALLWLERDEPDLDEARQALGRIVKDMNRAGDVIWRIRALIKKAPTRQDRVEINGAIREVIELTHGETAKSDISVRTRLADGLSLIHGDRVQLQQVILNLVINAVEAMNGVSDGPRQLLVSTESAEDGGVLVKVRDSGPGVVPTALGRLFDAFYTTKPGGMGMGLSICRSIVEAHGGHLWVTANQPRGVTFCFTVPAHPAAD
jgi:PAS domain S-box-containing protein